MYYIEGKYEEYEKNMKDSKGDCEKLIEKEFFKIFLFCALIKENECESCKKNTKHASNTGS